jgi:hypothetical protein
MNVWLAIGRIATGLNLVLLVGLSYVWLGNYRRHGARHTLALLIFGGFLLLENVVWLYLYVINAEYVAWYVATGAQVQIAIMGLCVLELIALLVLSRLAWQ